MKREAIAVGMYPARLSADGRLRLPTNWRNLFVTSAAPIVLLAPIEKSYLTMVPECRIKMERKAARAAERRPRENDKWQKDRDAVIAGFRLAREVRIRSGGRFTIPRELRDLVFPSPEVVLAGCFDSAEIWPRDEWEKVESGLLRNAKLLKATSRLGF
ncbi:MAG: hypothetical protein KA248_02085 [Kiritimatiellae bacterium]|nr:hypothetical protein [Kiritimatiellia bacterium]